MKSQIRILAIAVGLFFSAASFADTAAPATPPVVTPTPPASVPAPVPVPHAAKPVSGHKGKAAPMPTTAAAGGEPGKVWINGKSKTYHCFGTTYYGKTKTGEYMTEADAKAKGYHGIQGKDCPSK